MNRFALVNDEDCTCVPCLCGPSHRPPFDCQRCLGTGVAKLCNSCRGRPWRPDKKPPQGIALNEVAQRSGLLSFHCI